MKLKFSGLFFMIVSTVSAAGENEAVGCFTSGNINVKFVQIQRDGVSLGYVKYQKSDKAIPLVLISSSSERNADDRPEEYTLKWAEFINGKVNGQYTIVSQGARFYQFDYKSAKNVVTEFENNINAYSSDGTDCKW